MSDSVPALEPAIADLATDEARARFFDSHPELDTPELAWRLAEESGRRLRTDLDHADRLAQTARWLARRCGDARAGARAQRARANVLLFRRHYRAAVEQYHDATDRFDRAGDELEAAITRSSSLMGLGQLGRYERAQEDAERARVVFERHEDRLHLARLANNVGHLLARQDRFREALARYREALAHFREVGTEIDRASALRNIAVCLQDLNDFPAALDAYRRAAGYCDRHGQVLIGLEVRYNIAYLHFLRGEYDEAIRGFEQARRQSESHDDHHHRALCDLDLAEIYLELNLVEDAAHLAERACAAFADLGMPYETAKGFAYQAVAAARSGDRKRALGWLDRAEEIFRRQGNRVWGAMVELYRAQILYGAGRWSGAMASAQSAFDTFEGAGVPSRTASCELLLAHLALRGGDTADAERRIASAKSRLQGEGPPLLGFHGLLLEGSVHEVRGDLDGALNAYREAHERLERMRGALGTDELRIAFGNDKRRLYEALVDLTLQQADSSAVREQAFDYVETAKSRALADLLVFGPPRRRDEGETNGDLARLQERRRELASFYRQIEEAELSTDSDRRGRLSRLRPECRQRERALLRELRRLDATPGGAAAMEGVGTAGLQRIRAALPDDAALLEFFVARGQVYAFLVDRDRLEVRRVTTLTKIELLLRQLQFHFGRFSAGNQALASLGEALATQMQEILQSLHRELLEPLALPPGRLVVVPHGVLHHIPFHALHDGGGYLVDRMAVSYAPSATVLELCGRRERSWEPRSLVMGLPDERAPRILDEAREVARILPASELFVGAEATRERLIGRGGRCRYLHIAAHGLHRRDNPMFSAIQLGDSRLNLLDLYDIRLHAELVVLSGCATGVSVTRGTDEQVGLTRGVLFAGARAVLATLWDVNDESTATFMAAFYRGLIRGQSPAPAVREAMMTLRERHPHPYYWAPFFLTGAV